MLTIRAAQAGIAPVFNKGGGLPMATEAVAQEGFLSFGFGDRVMLCTDMVALSGSNATAAPDFSLSLWRRSAATGHAPSPVQFETW